MEQRFGDVSTAKRDFVRVPRFSKLFAQLPRFIVFDEFIIVI